MLILIGLAVQTPDTRRFTPGNVLMLNGAAVSWRFKGHSVFALSRLKLSSLQLVPWFRKLSSFSSFFIIFVSSRIVLLLFLLTMRRAFIGPRALLVAVIVLSILISASNLYVMHASKAFSSFRKLILNLMVKIF